MTQPLCPALGAALPSGWRGRNGAQRCRPGRSHAQLVRRSRCEKLCVRRPALSAVLRLHIWVTRTCATPATKPRGLWRAQRSGFAVSAGARARPASRWRAWRACCADPGTAATRILARQGVSMAPKNRVYREAAGMAEVNQRLLLQLCAHPGRADHDSPLVLAPRPMDMHHVAALCRWPDAGRTACRRGEPPTGTGTGGRRVCVKAVPVTMEWWGCNNPGHGACRCARRAPQSAPKSRGRTSARVWTPKRKLVRATPRPC